MTLSSLPLECLQLIFRILQQKEDQISLSRLLRTNSYFCHATLPYLYGGVFGGTLYSPSLAHPRSIKIVQILLSQRPPEDISNLLWAAYDLLPQRRDNERHETPDCSAAEDLMDVDRDKNDTRTQTSSHATEYISFIHSFHLESALYHPRCNLKDLVSHWTDCPSQLAGYEFRSRTGELADGLGDGCHDEEFLFPPELIAKISADLDFALWSPYNDPAS